MSTTTKPNAFLRGGPHHDEPDRPFVHHTGSGETIKISRGNCYDHFELTAERIWHDGVELPVFRWIRRTYVAE